MHSRVSKQRVQQQNKNSANLRMFRCVTQLREMNFYLYEAEMEYAQQSAKETAINHYQVNLKIHYYTNPDERLVIVGDKAFLGNWSISQGVRLQYEGEGWWSAKLFLYRPGVFEYKFVCQSIKGQKWEEGKNRVFDEKKLESKVQKRVKVFNLNQKWGQTSVQSSEQQEFQTKSKSSFLDISAQESEASTWCSENSLNSEKSPYLDLQSSNGMKDLNQIKQIQKSQFQVNKIDITRSFSQRNINQKKDITEILIQCNYSKQKSSNI